MAKPRNAYRDEETDSEDALGDPLPPEPDPNRQLTQAEKDADKKPLDREHALQLLKAGHRLRLKGAPPANWVTMTRHLNELVISFPATEAAIDELLNKADYLLAED